MAAATAAVAPPLEAAAAAAVAATLVLALCKGLCQIPRHRDSFSDAQASDFCTEVSTKCLPRHHLLGD